MGLFVNSDWLINKNENSESTKKLKPCLTPASKISRVNLPNAKKPILKMYALKDAITYSLPVCINCQKVPTGTF